MKAAQNSVTSRKEKLSPPRSAAPLAPISPTQHQTVPRAPPGASPYTSVPGQRSYGKGPVRLWGATEYERAGGMLFWHVEAAKVQQLQQVRR